MADPINRTILLLDIEKSGRRLNVEKEVIRRLLYSVLRDTLRAASVEPTEYRTEDRGDGAFVLIDATVPKPHLLRALIGQTPTLLYDHNRLANPTIQVRLRIVVHSGEVALDAEGALGTDLDEAFRLLDTDPLRNALASTTEPSTLCVSDAVFRGVVNHSHPGIRREHFHRFTAGSKEGILTGWIHDSRHESDVDRTVSEARGTPEVSGASDAGAQQPLPIRIGSGNLFFGAGARVLGDAVGGHKYVGWHGPEDGAS